jgi:hypothetical protein
MAAVGMLYPATQRSRGVALMSAIPGASCPAGEGMWCCWKSCATAPTTSCVSPTTCACPTSNRAERDVRPSKIQQKITV